MNINKKLDEALDTDTFQVFLLQSACTIPFMFSSHAYFIVNNRWIIERWEVLVSRNQCKTSWWFLHLNALKPQQWIKILPFLKFRWPVKIIWVVEWKTAKEMIWEIRESPKNYPYNYRYKLLWPNSNSYAAWIIHKFPHCWIHLLGNAVGKKYFDKI